MYRFIVLRHEITEICSISRKHRLNLKYKEQFSLSPKLRRSGSHLKLLLHLSETSILLTKKVMNVKILRTFSLSPKLKLSYKRKSVTRGSHSKLLLLSFRNFHPAH